MAKRGRKKKIEKDGIPYNRSEYYKSYYESRREEFAERRRKRYQNDPEYRERAIKSAIRYREKKEQEVQQLIDMGVLSKPKKEPRMKTMKVKIGDVEVEAFGMPVFLAAINKNRLTVKLWIEKGVLPDTPFKTSSGYRLYTNCMIGVVLDAIDGIKSVKKDMGIYERVVKGWEKCGITQDMLQDESKEI